MKPILFFSYARSGGTLMNKCLLNLPNTIVLSEINPTEFGEGLWENRPSINHIVQQQVKQWYDLELDTKNFDDSILKLISYCSKNKIQLIIRDFSIADFVSSPLLNNQPNNKLSWLKWMNKHHIRYKCFSLIRQPMDVWISQQMPDLRIFTIAYTKYLEELKHNQISYFYFEKFTTNPEKELNKILKHLEIKFPASKLINIENKNQLFGDLKNNKRSPRSEIKVLKQKPIPIWKWKKAHTTFQSNKTFIEFFDFPTPLSTVELILKTFIYYQKQFIKTMRA